MAGSVRRFTWILPAAFAAALVGCVSTAPSPPASALSPSPSATISATPELTPVPGSPSVAPTPAPQDINEFELPTPACPSPAKASSPPEVRVAVGSADPIVATHGASTLQTCSTVGTNDVTADDPKVGVTAH